MSGGSTHTALLNRVESIAFHLINSPPLSDCLDSLSHRHNVASLFIFCRYFYANCSSELANCMPPPSRGLSAQGFLLLLIPILSIFLMQELTSIFILSSLTLVNFETLFVCFSTCLWLKLFQKRSVKTSLILNWTSIPFLYFFYCSLYRVWRQVGFFFFFFFFFFFLTYFCLPLANTPSMKKK